MLRTIQLQIELRFRAVEIQEVRADRMFSARLVAGKPSVAQKSPQVALRARNRLPQPACARDVLDGRHGATADEGMRVTSGWLSNQAASDNPSQGVRLSVGRGVSTRTRHSTRRPGSDVCQKPESGAVYRGMNARHGSSKIRACGQGGVWAHLESVPCPRHEGAAWTPLLSSF